MKPIVYAPVPEFDQLTQYVIQLPPVDMGDHIYVGNEVRQMEIEEEPGMPE
jgi:hypothetical protein